MKIFILAIWITVFGLSLDGAIDSWNIKFFPLVAINVSLAAISLWQFKTVLGFGIYERTTVAGPVTEQEDGLRKVKTFIPDFGEWELTLSPEVAMREGDYMKFKITVNSMGPRPLFIPIKFGNINDKK